MIDGVRETRQQKRRASIRYLKRIRSALKKQAMAHKRPGGAAAITNEDVRAELS